MKPDLHIVVSTIAPTALERADTHFAEARRESEAAALSIFGGLDKLGAELIALGEKPQVLTSASIHSDARRVAYQLFRDVERMRVSLKGTIR